MDLSIVLVSWNTKDLIIACLESVSAEIGALDELDVETYVVDNGSTDGSPDAMRSLFPWVRLIENQQNIGFGAANNQAMRQATGRYVLLLNSDTEVHIGAFTSLVSFLENHPEIGAVGPLLLNTDGTFQLSCDPEPTLGRELCRLLHLDRMIPYGIYNQEDWPRNQCRSVDVIKGACMLIRQEVLAEVGLFDEDFFIYSEEVDLCTRIRRAGWQISWVPNAVVTHHGGQSTKLVAAEMFQNLYKYKLLYFRKNHGALSAEAYKVILAIGALARVAAIPVTARLGSQEQRVERRALAANYRHLLAGLARL